MNLSQATCQANTNPMVIITPTLHMSIQKSGKRVAVTDDMIGKVLQRLIKNPCAV